MKLEVTKRERRGENEMRTSGEREAAAKGSKDHKRHNVSREPQNLGPKENM